MYYIGTTLVAAAFGVVAVAIESVAAAEAALECNVVSTKDVVWVGCSSRSIFRK